MLHHHHIRTIAASALALAAITAPAAAAHDRQAGWIVRPNPDQQAAQLTRTAAAQPVPTSRIVHPNPDEQTPAPAPTTIVRVTTPTDGFDWGDAGIGAAAGVALSMIGLGGALAVSQRRTRRSRGTAAVTS
jgi:hypothetical protein